MNLMPYSAVIGAVPGTMEQYQLYQPILIHIGIVCCNPLSRLDSVDYLFVEYPINTCCTPHIFDKPLFPIIPSTSIIDISHLDLKWVGSGKAYLNLQFLHAQHKLWLRPVGEFDCLLPSLDVTNPIDAEFHIHLDSHTKLVGLARFLDVVNSHKLVVFHETLSDICGHAHDLESFL